VNGGDLFLPTRTQTFEQEYSDLTVSNRRPSTSQPITATLPKEFHKKPDRMLSRGRQNMCKRFWRTPNLSQIFWRVKVLSVVLWAG